MTANFITEDSYLGRIQEPLTLNRYNYCISSYLNYVDPSGNDPDYMRPAEAMEYMYWLTGDKMYGDLAGEMRQFEMEIEYYEASTMAGVVDSVLANLCNTVVITYDVGAFALNFMQSYFARELGAGYGDKMFNYPFPLIPLDAVDNYLAEKASAVWNMENYYTGRCAGDILVTAVNLAVSVYGIYNIFNGLMNVDSCVSSSGSNFLRLSNDEVVEVGRSLVTGKALVAGRSVLAGGLACDALKDLQNSVSKIGKDKRSTDARGEFDSPQGFTKKYIPKSGEWRATGKKLNQWLKENGYTLGEDHFHGRGGQNRMSFDIFDKDGNVIGRLDRNYRVNGKVVPDHVHLKSDSINVHYWFND